MDRIHSSEQLSCSKAGLNTALQRFVASTKVREFSVQLMQGDKFAEQ